MLLLVRHLLLEAMPGAHSAGHAFFKDPDSQVRSGRLLVVGRFAAVQAWTNRPFRRPHSLELIVKTNPISFMVCIHVYVERESERDKQSIKNK